MLVPIHYNVLSNRVRLVTKDSDIWLILIALDRRPNYIYIIKTVTADVTKRRKQVIKQYEFLEPLIRKSTPEEVHNNTS